MRIIMNFRKSSYNARHFNIIIVLLFHQEYIPQGVLNGITFTIHLIIANKNL